MTADSRQGSHLSGSRSESSPQRAESLWPRTWWLSVAVLGGVALVLRLFMLDEFLRENVIAERPWSDGEVYWEMAGRMAAGEWVGRTPFLSAPLYPYLLGVVRACGGGLTAVYMLQIGLHIATALLLAWTTRLRFGNLSGVLAAGLYLLLTEPAVSSMRVMANTLQVFLVVVVWWRWAAATRHDLPRWRDVVLVGALLGVLALAYPPGLALVPVYAIWVWIQAGRRGAAVARALAGFAAAVLALAPATLHNLLLHGEFVPITAHSGITLRQGNGPTSSGIGDVIPGISLRRDRMHADAARVFAETYGRQGSWREIDRHFRREAISFWLENPGAALRLWAQKLYLYVAARNYDEIMPSVIERELGIGTRALLAPLAVPWLIGAGLVGLLGALRRPVRLAPEWLLCLLPLATVLLFFYAPRYRLPSVPLLCALAAYALTHVRRLGVPAWLVVAGIAIPVPLYWVNRSSVVDSPAFVRTSYVRAQSEALSFAADRRAQARQFEQAEQHYRAAIELWAENPLPHRGLGRLYLAQDRLEEAVGALREAVRLRPRSTPLYFDLYNALQLQGQYADAATALRQATRISPKAERAHLALAWLRATCPAEDVRDGEQAVRAAEEALRLIGTPQSDALDVLAAAYAEAGRFSDAAEVGSRAAALARREGRAASDVAEIEQRVRHYREREPCRAPPRALRPK
jgi:Flp pilus assembly protein TadD